MAKTEKKEMIGHCLYCGQEVMVEAESDSMADLEASRNCNCDNIIKRKSQLKVLIEDQCGEGALRYQMQPVKKEAETLIQAVGDAILDRTIEAANIKVADTIVSISASKSGCKMSRKRAISISSEV